MAEVASQIAKHPVDSAKMMLSPPAGTNDYVKSLYYAQNADIVLDIARGSKKGIIKISSALGSDALKKADVFITKTIVKKLEQAGLRRVTYGALRQSGKGFAKNLAAGLMKGGLTAVEKSAQEATEKAVKEALKDASEQIAKKEGIPLLEASAKASASAAGKLVAEKGASEAEKKAIIAINKLVKEAAEKAAVKASEKLAIKYGSTIAIKTSIMLSRMAATSAVLAEWVPVGTIVDAVLMGLQVFGLIYEIFDKSGISTVMGPGEIKEAVSQIVETAEVNIADAGVPGYYSEEAEFPVTDLIFQWDPTSNSYSMTPEWGPMYTGLLDKYMASQGFKSNWRTLMADDALSLSELTKPSGPSPTGPSPTLVLILLILVIVVLTGVGLLFFLID